jgi:hypothetical protein
MKLVGAYPLGWRCGKGGINPWPPNEAMPFGKLSCKELYGVISSSRCVGSTEFGKATDVRSPKLRGRAVGCRWEGRDLT